MLHGETGEKDKRILKTSWDRLCVMSINIKQRKPLSNRKENEYQEVDFQFYSALILYLIEPKFLSEKNWWDA